MYGINITRYIPTQSRIKKFYNASKRIRKDIRNSQLPVNGFAISISEPKDHVQLVISCWHTNITWQLHLGSQYAFHMFHGNCNEKR